MKRSLLIILSGIFLAMVMAAIALYVPSSLPAGSDFSALYNTDLALVNGVPIYDLEAVEAVAVEVSGIPSEKFFLARFPYPPWYALSTFYLGLMPAQAAATLWFEINLLLLFLSIGFLTDGWDGRLRLIAFPLGLLFLPVIGALSVGQYDFPVLLGISMLVYSLRRANIPLTVLGVILLTFKPHVGALVMVSAVGWLIASRGDFRWRAMRAILIAGVALFLVGFIADPAWAVRYPAMLLNYQGEGNVSSCSECASLPVFLSRWFFDGSLSRAAVIALVSLAVWLMLFHRVRTALLQSHALFLNAAVLVTLLVSPYLYNYDFILLLAPFAFLLEEKNMVRRVIVGICYLVPSLLIVMYGRAGNLSLLVAALMLAMLVFLRAKHPVDVNRLAAYNTNT
jgi:hypothetical protein